MILHIPSGSALNHTARSPAAFRARFAAPSGSTANAALLAAFAAARTPRSGKAEASSRSTSRRSDGSRWSVSLCTACAARSLISPDDSNSPVPASSRCMARANPRSRDACAGLMRRARAI